MGNANAITLIAKMSLTAFSIKVRVSVDTRPRVRSDLVCAAYERNVDYGFLWHPPFASHSVRVEKDDVRRINRMDDILFDAAGVPIKPKTRYWVKCFVKRRGDLIGTSLRAKFRTRKIPTPECLSGVSFSINNGNNYDSLPQHGPLTSSTDVLDFGGVSYSNFHDNIDGMYAYEFPHPTPRDMDIKLTCCEGTECIFWVSLYRCAECTGEKPNGLTQELILRGWDSGSCSPRFDEKFRTTAFHTKIDATDGTVTEIIPSKHHEILTMFGVEGDCPEDWCVKSHGPFPAGPGCESNGCPNDSSP